MRNLRFESIYLLSQSEQKARMIKFHPRLNLLVGKNHTGKSSLIKSLFVALGARPEGKLEKWDPGTVTLLQLTISGTRYHIVQQSGYRALFSDKGTFLRGGLNSTGWADAFRQITKFNLVLTDKSKNAVAADARAFFLPFYINQDGSWHADWNTFENLEQYTAPVKPILEYFTGVKPPEFYEISALKSEAKGELSELQREHRLIEQIRQRFGKSLPLTGPKTIPALFESDIEQLTRAITELNEKQEILRDQEVREREVIDSLRVQVRLADDALRTYDSDSSFLAASATEKLVCPVCQAEHNKAFMDVLSYAEDARVLRELVIKLQGDLSLALSKSRHTNSRLGDLERQYQQVDVVLQTRRGNLKFDDVVRSMGAEAAFEAFHDELNDLKKKIDVLLSEIEGFDAKLKALTNSQRSKEILSTYRDTVAFARQELNLPADIKKGLTLISRPKVSGSGGPRSVLAYYAAIWAAALGEHGSFSVPLVIDSPQQQGQDEFNLPKMIEFVARKLPPKAQVILSVEAPTAEKFDQVTLLDTPYSLLNTSEYQSVNSIVEPYVRAMYRGMISPSSP